MIVTIDGPAGAGKSTAARALARSPGLRIPRHRGDVPRRRPRRHAGRGRARRTRPACPASWPACASRWPPAASRSTARTSAGRSARRKSRRGRRSWRPARSSGRVSRRSSGRSSTGRDFVCEGRDQGTVVFPDAPCKFFLTADAEERLRRRAGDLRSRGTAVEIDALRREQAERDHRDSHRELAPLRPAPDAILVDSTGRTLEEVVSLMEGEVRRRIASAPSGDVRRRRQRESVMDSWQSECGIVSISVGSG